MTILSTNAQLEYDLLNIWLDASDTGLCVADSMDKVVLINQKACHYLAVHGLTCLDKPLTNIFRNAEYQHGRPEWLRKKELVGARQETMNTPEGQLHLSLNKRHIKHANGEEFKFISLTDITGMVQAQAQLEARNRQWQAINAGVVLSDATSHGMPIVYVNPAFEEMTGYPAAEVVGRNCSFLQAHDREQPALEAIREAIKNKTTGYAVLRNYRKDGSLFMNELFISPVADAHGNVIQFLGIQHIRISDQTLVAGYANSKF